MPEERLVRQVRLAKPMGRRIRRRPRTVITYISNLAWFCLGVELAELHGIAVNHEVFPPRAASSARKSQTNRVHTNLQVCDNLWIMREAQVDENVRKTFAEYFDLVSSTPRTYGGR